jgi:SAM-dependent methyltransferase
MSRAENQDDSVDVDPDIEARRLASESLAVDDPTGWFERLYAAAEDGAAVVPWDRGMAHPLLSDWVSVTRPDGAGKRALIIGCGTGWDAELIADLGYETVAFDVSPTGIEAARKAHPDSVVQYQTADLLTPPAEWRQAFDLVVEIFTVQSLPVPMQSAATKQVSAQVAPGGTLVVIAAARADAAEPPVEGPPWPLNRAAMGAFGTDGLRLLRLEHLPVPTAPDSYRWRAEYLRG